MAKPKEVTGSISMAERARQVQAERVVTMPRKMTEPIRPVEKKPEPVEEVIEPVEEEKVVEPEPEIDYKAELEKANKAKEKAEFTLYKMNKAAKENKTEPVEKTEVASEVEAILKEREIKDARNILLEEVGLLTSNEDERELIINKYDNSIVKSGFTRAEIRQDLEDARFLANKTKYVRQTEELTRAAVSKRTLGTDGQGTNQDKPHVEDDPSKYFSKRELAFMQEDPKVYTKDKIKQLIAKRK